MSSKRLISSLSRHAQTSIGMGYARASYASGPSAVSSILDNASKQHALEASYLPSAVKQFQTFGSLRLATPACFSAQIELSTALPISTQQGQVRAMSTGDGVEESEDSDPTIIKKQDGEEEFDESLYHIEELERVERPKGINMDQYLRMDNQDTLELLVQAKDNFLKKDERTIPIPQSVREVMYRHRWDKVIVDVRRLVYRTKNNKREQYTAMVASGNQKGLLGLGMGSAETAQLAVARAYLDSFSNLAAVPLYRGHTVYHHVEHHFQRVKVTLSPRTSGWGLRCSNLFYELCSLAGIRDLTVDVSGATRNKFFVAKAFFDALQKQTAPHDGVEGTGVYVKEVVRRPVVNLGTYRNNGTLPPKEYLATEAL